MAMLHVMHSIDKSDPRMHKLMKTKDYDAKNVVKDYEKAIFQNVKCIGLSINTLIPNVYDKFCKRIVRVPP